MKLELKIYKGKAVEKIYTAAEFDIMFGTVEDVVALIDVDALSGEGDDMDLVKACMNMLSGGIGKVKDLLKDIFTGVTDEELRRVKIKELVPLFLNLVKFSLDQIKSVGTEKK